MAQLTQAVAKEQSSDKTNLARLCKSHKFPELGTVNHLFQKRANRLIHGCFDTNKKWERLGSEPPSRKPSLSEQVVSSKMKRISYWTHRPLRKTAFVIYAGRSENRRHRSDTRRGVSLDRAVRKCPRESPGQPLRGRHSRHT